MSNPTPIAIRYTDEIYATPAQVGKSLHMVVYDDFWKQIMVYREENKVVLPFGKIKGRPFYFTLTQPIRIKIQDFERKIKDFLSLSRSMLLSKEKETRIILLSNILKEGAILEKSNINDLSIKMLLNSLYKESDNNHTPVVNYLSSIDYYLGQTPSAPNDDFLAGAYQRVLGQEELMDFYREKDFDKKVEHLAYIRDPDYPYAPHDLIEDSMEGLIGWLESDEFTPAFVHAFIAANYLFYIKPFDQRNSLMAALLAKEVIAENTGFSEAFVLPFELLLKDSFKNSDAYKESKARCDMTYALFEGMSVFSLYLDNVAEQLKNLRISQYKGEYSILGAEEENIADKIQQEKEPKGPTQLSFLNVEETTKRKKEIASPQEPSLQKNQENLKRESTYSSQSEDSKRGGLNEEKAEIPIVSSLANGNSPSPKDPLSKSEIKDYIRYLLETNPNLNKKQATFLANHCTPGRFYTIQQFKDFASCVYETARTSMDKLAQEGYYEKLQFKNKFVYSPIKKGN